MKNDKKIDIASRTTAVDPTDEQLRSIGQLLHDIDTLTEWHYRIRMDGGLMAPKNYRSLAMNYNRLAAELEKLEPAEVH